MQGLIVNSYGYQFIVEVDNRNYQTVTKAKKTEFVVGDLVEVQLINEVQAQIIDLIPRDNLIYRSDRHRSKIIASNIDQIVIVIAVKPNFNISFLNSSLVCAEVSKVEPLIVINKMDLGESGEFAKKIRDLYVKNLGYNLLELNALDNCKTLENFLLNKRSILIGQSGVGKSTITNKIYPEAAAKTGEITKYETSGAHTTTHASLYHINENSDLIDCPGLQEFGLYHLELSEIAEYFPEMEKFLGHCKFNNCLHLTEPACQVHEAVENGHINLGRYQFYQRLCESLKFKKHY